MQAYIDEIFVKISFGSNKASSTIAFSTPVVSKEVPVIGVVDIPELGT
jgi:hypothetical protein